MTGKPLENSFLPECLVLFVVNLLMFTVGVRLYGQPFHFQEYPLSELGAVRTQLGFDNSPSRRVFSAQLLFNSIFFFIMGKKLHLIDTRYQRNYLIFSWTVAIGMLILIYPYDFNNTFHSIGTAMMAAGILMIHTYAVKDIWEKRKDSFLLYLCILEWVVLLLYAFASAVDLSSKHAIQKPAVLMLGITTLVISPYIKKTAREENRKQVAVQEEKVHDQSR